MRDESVHSHSTLQQGLLARPYDISLTRALWVHLKNAIPLFIMYFILLAVRSATVHFLKDEGVIVVGSIGLAINIAWIGFQGVFVALDIGLLSRMAQAFGARDYRLLGIYFQRGVINDLLLSIPLTLVMIFSERILVGLGYSEEIAKNTHTYLVLILPGLYCGLLAEAISVYLNSADIFIPPAIFQSISALISIASGYYFVIYKKLGMIGAAYSFNVMHIVNFLQGLGYLWCRNPVKNSLFCLEANVFSGLWDLFKHQVIVGSMLLLEWIFGSIMTFFAGKLREEEMAAWVGVYTNIGLSYTMCIALMDTTLTFMGNSMGEGNTRKAKTFLGAALIICGCGTFIIEIVYGIFTRQIVDFYLEDQQAVGIGIVLLRLFIYIWPPDSMQMVLGAGLRAIGKEKSGTLSMLTGLYVLALPIAYYLAFHTHYRVEGLLVGEAFGYYFVFFANVLIYCRVDWDLLRKEIEDKIHADESRIGSPEIQPEDWNLTMLRKDLDPDIGIH